MIFAGNVLRAVWNQEPYVVQDRFGVPFGLPGYSLSCDSECELNLVFFILQFFVITGKSWFIMYALYHILLLSKQRRGPISNIH